MNAGLPMSAIEAVGISVLVGHPGTGKTHELAGMADELRRKRFRVYFAAFTRSVRDEARWRGIPDEDRHARTFAGWVHVAFLRSVGAVVLPPDESWKRFRKAAAGLGIRCGLNPWTSSASRCWRVRHLMHLAIHVAGPGWLDALRRVDDGAAKLAEAYLSELGSYLDHDLAMLEAATKNEIEPPWGVTKTSNNNNNGNNKKRRVAVLVDEAQDLSPLMWCLLKRWANPELPAPKWCGDSLGTVDMVVLAGDPNQSIFESLNGADPQLFVRVGLIGDARVEVLRFSKRVPKAVYTRFAKPLMDAIGNPYAEYVPNDVNGAAVTVPVYGDTHGEVAKLVARIRSEFPDAEIGVVTDTNDDALEVILRLVRAGYTPCTLKMPPVRELECREERPSLVVDTVYAWKGREADVVIYLAEKSAASSGLALRLAYVAVTRARRAAFVVCSRHMDRRLRWLCA